MLTSTTLSSNTFKAYFQLLGWFLFNRSRWSYFVSQIDSNLSANFSFISIFSFSTPHIKQLISIVAFVQPLIVGLFIGYTLIFFKIFGYPYQHFVPDLIYGITVGIMLASSSGILCSFFVSLPFSLLAAGIASFSGLLFGLTISYVNDMWAIVILAFALSFAGSVAIALEPKRSQVFLANNVGNLLIGIGAGILIIFAVWFVGYRLLGEIIVSPMLSTEGLSKQDIEIKELSVCYISTSIVAGLTFAWLLTKSKRIWGFALTFILGVFVFIFLYLVLDFIPNETLPNSLFRRSITGPARGTFYGLSFGMMFILAYSLTKQISNWWAGFVSGTVTCIVGFFTLADQIEYGLLIACIVLSIFGFTQKYWFLALTYLFESAWNLILYNRLENNLEHVAKLLPQHAAFWHETQHYPFKDLPKMLLLARKTNSELARKALLYLSHTPQKWVVPTYYLEENLYLLESCKQVKHIEQIHTQLEISSNLPEQEWLQLFNKNSLQVKSANSKPLFSQKKDLVRKTINELTNHNLSATSGEIQQRFTEIVGNWETILSHWLEKLEHIQNLPIPNPYIFGPPLHGTEQSFAPRQEVVSLIKEQLLQFSGNSLLLYGQRRMGKTTLLRNLQKSLPENIIVVFLDAQGTLFAENEKQFFHLLCCAIVNELKPLNIPLPKTDIEAICHNQIYFNEWLNELEHLLGDYSILIALDEFEALEKLFNKGVNQDIVLGTLRHLAQHHAKIRLIYASAYKLEELGDGNWPFYLVNLRYINLGYLPNVEAEKLICTPVEDFPLNYLDDAKQHILDVTQNHPALLQALCNIIVFIKNRQLPEFKLQVQVQDVEEAISEVLKFANAIFAGMAKEARDMGKQILCFMARQNKPLSEQELLQTCSDAEQLSVALNL